MKGDHMYSARPGRSFVAALIAATAGLLLAGTANADPVKCKAAIIKASSSFAQAKAKALQKCEDTVVKGKLPQGTDCSNEIKAAAGIAKAATKLAGAINKGCGGGDKVCGGSDDDTATVIGFPTTCPNFENGACNGAVGPGDCTGITACVQCIGEAAVDQAIALSYDDLVTSDPKAQKVLNKCQAAIGKAALTFFNAKSKILAKCWDAVNKGKATGPCPTGVEAPKIAAAAAKLSGAILKACAGKDKAIGGTDVNADLTPTEIGFPANCQAVDPPGAEAACDGAIANLQDLIDCVTCVNEFKVDCADAAGAAALAAYPTECNPGPVITPTPTPIATPTVTVTPTPAPGCGNGTLDGGEICDPNAAGAAGECPNVNDALFPCTNICTCDCPGTVAFSGDPADPATILDTGWNGIAHRAPVISNGDVTVTLSCAAPGRPCGVCTVSGPVANTGAAQLRNQRCTNDTSIQCTSSAQCSGGGTCQFFFGGPLPLVAGGVGTCVVNQFNGSVSGTANVETGEASTTANLISRVHSAPSTDTPCPTCVGDNNPNDGGVTDNGTCAGGSTRDGLACDANGSVPGRPDFGTTSFDCPPSAGVIASLPIDLTNSTGTVTKAVTASSPNCSADSAQKCVCDTCNNAAAGPCDSNADCPISGGNPGICGGRRCLGGTNDGGPCGGAGAGASACPGMGSCGRPGNPTLPNACADQTAVPGDGTVCIDTAPIGDNEGECLEGPLTGVCSAASGHAQRSCGNANECCDDAPGCVSDPVTPGDCVITNRLCFLDNGLGGSIEADGAADPPVNDVSEPTLAAVFCIAPTSLPAVNAAAGLPGPGRVTIKGTAVGQP
jgi:hypothetical protein